MEIDPSFVFIPLIISAFCIVITCWMAQKILAQVIESVKILSKVLLVGSLMLWGIYIVSVFWTEGMDKGLEYIRSIYGLTLSITHRVPKEILYILDTVRYAVVQRWNMH